jgi:GNAT superfamily N-acetyltransferase
MEFHVRRAAIGDEAVLRALRLQALTDAPEAFGSTIERELARTIEDWWRWLAPGVTFLLEAGGEPLGLVSGIRDVQHSSVALLMAMWVHPDLRGTGAADALMSAVKAWAGEVRGRRYVSAWLRTISVRVDSTNGVVFAIRAAEE